LGEEAVERRGGTIEDDADVGIARGPGVAQEGGGGLLVDRDDGVAQVMKRLAQRSPPCLAPFRVSAGLAPAVGPPAFDAVDAAPRGVLMDADLMSGRMEREELAVVGEADAGGTLDVVESGGEGHVAVAVVVPVALA